MNTHDEEEEDSDCLCVTSYQDICAARNARLLYEQKVIIELKDKAKKMAQERLERMTQSIKDEVACSVCLETMDLPAGLSTCSHKFCRECIASALKVKPECPECRAPATQRDIQDDITLGAMINALRGQGFLNQADLDGAAGPARIKPAGGKAIQQQGEQQEGGGAADGQVEAPPRQELEAAPLEQQRPEEEEEEVVEEGGGHSD